MTTTHSTTSSPDVTASLTLIEVKPGKKFPLTVLKSLLPDVATILFFGKLYGLDYRQLSSLLYSVHSTPLSQALAAGDHSTDLQDYLIGGYDEDGNYVPGIIPPHEQGDITFKGTPPPQGEILPEVWDSLEVQIANSIKEVADKLDTTLGLLPGKTGQMVFKTLAQVNARRPIIGDYRASIKHAPQKRNLVVFDVSGSMSQHTVQTIVEDVVAMSYKADAALAIVSNTCTFWEAGAFSVDSILNKAEYGGTHYEKLVPLFENQDWGTVITIADYDSSPSAKGALQARARGTIDQLLDISLVNQPTYLAECLGHLAKEVRPLLVANGSLTRSYY